MNEPTDQNQENSAEFPTKFKDKLTHFNNLAEGKREKFEVKIQRKTIQRLKTSVEPLKRRLSNITRPIVVVGRSANPIYGKLCFTIISSSMILISFIFELIYNHNSFNGRCITPIVHPPLTNGDMITKKHLPYIVNIGYGACEVNLNESANNRAFIGNGTLDNGWPLVNLKKYDKSTPSGRFDTPNARIFEALGGLNSNKIRNYKEYYRIIWSMFLHGSVIHMLFNLCCQIQSLWMIEPDWGFLRTSGLYFVSGIFGNLLSAVLDPCGTTVGSSGAMYGLMGALIPYCIEYWALIARPTFILIFVIFSVFLGLVGGLSGYTDNYAHLGGFVAGVLWGFGTIDLRDKDKLRKKARCAEVAKSIEMAKKLEMSKNALIANDAGAPKEGKVPKDGEEPKEAEAHKEVGAPKEVTMPKGFVGRIIEKNKEYWKGSRKEWILRIGCMSLLLIFIIVLSVILGNEKIFETFSPPGQLKFEGWQSCHCCKVLKQNVEGRNKKYVINSDGMSWCFHNLSVATYFCNLQK